MLLFAVPDNLNDHTSLSVDTFANVIAESLATRVFARLPLAYGHDAGARGDAEAGEAAEKKSASVVTTASVEIVNRARRPFIVNSRTTSHAVQSSSSS
jgi:hypothetical protein